jgi:hypothetical protein
MSEAEQVCPGCGHDGSWAAGPNTPRTVVPSGSYATAPSVAQWPLDVTTIASPWRA